MKRRLVIKHLTALPWVAGNLGASAIAAPGTMQPGVDTVIVNTKETNGSKNIYESLGVQTVINGRGTVTIIGASRMLPEVEMAMKAATQHYVQIDELMYAVAEKIGAYTGSEWGIITSGASGALTVAAAGIVTGGDPDKLWRLPKVDDMKNEVIIPSYSWTAYAAAVRDVGAKMVEVETIQQLRNAINAKTAMILVLAGNQSEEGPLCVKAIAELVKPLGIPILVDAAAEGLSLPNPHLSQGADLVAYSGGKYLNGPQCAGLLIGRKHLVQAAWTTSAPHHGFGRGYKVGREEIMGMFTAVEMWWKRNHAAEKRVWQARLHFIAKVLHNIRGVTTSIRQPLGRSNPSPDLYVTWDAGIIPLTGYDVENLLWEGSPRVAVSGAGSYLPFPPNVRPEILINTSQLKDGEEKIIADRVYKILSAPPKLPQNNAAADVDISGKWELNIQFAATIGLQQLIIEQKGNMVEGTHIGSYAARTISGSVHGTRLLLRSSYTRQGVRLNFEFSGTAAQDFMQGTINMGEYGIAQWKGRRI
ncbi:MAG: aminotransferase class V-fold PLP-dependent enzyme [Chitinophagaceae bacterium]|nr:aminotransferase class V-fold PLP-dependent enzyme [Chitinophagaceae bacterium]